MVPIFSLPTLFDMAQMDEISIAQFLRRKFPLLRLKRACGRWIVRNLN